MQGRNKDLVLCQLELHSRGCKQLNGGPSNAILKLSLNCFALQEFHSKNPAIFCLRLSSSFALNLEFRKLGAKLS